MEITYYLLIVVFCVSHSVLVLPSVKQKMYSFISQKNYRLFFNIFSVALLLAIYYSYVQLPRIVIFAFTGQKIVGVVLVLLGSYLATIAFKAYNSLEFFGLAVESENQTLNTTGMNKYVRHPLYSATLLLLLGLLVLEPTRAFFGLSILMFIYLLIGIKLEEKKLIQTFGQAYRNYLKEVPMLIPRLRKK